MQHRTTSARRLEKRAFAVDGLAFAVDGLVSSEFIAFISCVEFIRSTEYMLSHATKYVLEGVDSYRFPESAKYMILTVFAAFS